MANLSPTKFSEDELLHLARVEHFIDQYEANCDYLRKDGMSVADYVRTSLRDCGAKEEPSISLIAALDKLQATYGAPLNPTNPLSFI